VRAKTSLKVLPIVTPAPPSWIKGNAFSMAFPPVFYRKIENDFILIGPGYSLGLIYSVLKLQHSDVSVNFLPYQMKVDEGRKGFTFGSKMTFPFDMAILAIKLK
jgi:hypothetical protein